MSLVNCERFRTTLSDTIDNRKVCLVYNTKSRIHCLPSMMFPNSYTLWKSNVLFEHPFEFSIEYY